ncbi:hypothetical protein SLA2020_426920 [Shorea laevis]
MSFKSLICLMKKTMLLEYGPRVEEGENEEGHGDGHNEGEEDGGPSEFGRAEASGFDDGIKDEGANSDMAASDILMSSPNTDERMIWYLNLACMCFQT